MYLSLPPFDLYGVQIRPCLRCEVEAVDDAPSSLFDSGRRDSNDICLALSDSCTTPRRNLVAILQVYKWEQSIPQLANCATKDAALPSHEPAWVVRGLLTRDSVEREQY